MRTPSCPPTIPPKGIARRNLKGILLRRVLVGKRHRADNPVVTRHEAKHDCGKAGASSDVGNDDINHGALRCRAADSLRLVAP